MRNEIQSNAPYPALQNPSGGFFWKTLFVIVSAWTLGGQIGELFTLELCCRRFFAGASLETPWESLENAYAQKGNRPIAVWNRSFRGVIPRGSHSELSVLYSPTHSLGRHFSPPTASRQERQARSRAEFSHPLAYIPPC